ncbi:hypothetical protein DdX_21805 [Ditylenchus destructor]|uniref:Uncharacterized protein n=1 Tax=Ditylenchus destructor TaxID=166010 RepID=A0AAD4MFU6_9BILA|nr:hypothetical protein DdX_21805 [Ditylenchus destructor]
MSKEDLNQMASINAFGDEIYGIINTTDKGLTKFKHLSNTFDSLLNTSFAVTLKIAEFYKEADKHVKFCKHKLVQKSNLQDLFTAAHKLYNVLDRLDASTKSPIPRLAQSTLEERTGECIDNNGAWNKSIKMPLEQIGGEIKTALSDNLKELKNPSCSEVLKSPRSIAYSFDALSPSIADICIRQYGPDAEEYIYAKFHDYALKLTFYHTMCMASDAVTPQVHALISSLHEVYGRNMKEYFNKTELEITDSLVGDKNFNIA